MRVTNHIETSYLMLIISLKIIKLLIIYSQKIG